jgi:hypothetical protein
MLAAVAAVSAATSLAQMPAASAQPPPVDALAPGYPLQVLDAAGNGGTACTAGFMVRDGAGTPRC